MFVGLGLMAGGCLILGALGSPHIAIIILSYIMISAGIILISIAINIGAHIMF